VLFKLSRNYAELFLDRQTLFATEFDLSLLAWQATNFAHHGELFSARPRFGGADKRNQIRHKYSRQALAIDSGFYAEAESERVVDGDYAHRLPLRSSSQRT
jgi:hypothetical protein